MMSSVIQVSGKEYKITGTIGQGAAAIVYLAKDSYGQSYAIKMIKNYNNPIIKNMVDAQIAIQKEFSGNNHVIQYIDYMKQEKFAYIVLQLGECSLKHWIDTSRQIWQIELINVICDACEGLKDIHSKKVIHRDIKPQNIIKKDNTYKITDFGVSSQSEQDEGITGTPLYWAPEILFQQTEKFTAKVDVWSLGVTIFEVYFKVNPFCPNKKLPERQALQYMKKNIKQLTPHFTMQKFMDFLDKKKYYAQVDYIQKKLKNTDKRIVQNMIMFLQPDPEKRPDIDLLYILFDSLKNEIIAPDVKKTQKSPKFPKWDQIPEDIRLFCRAKDLFYEINAYYKTKLYDKIIFALELGIWYLQGVNYGGINYIFLDQMQLIKVYRKPAAELWKQVKQILMEYYFILKTDDTFRMYEKINQVRMHMLVCSNWWDIVKDDKFFCKKVSSITKLEIEHPLQLFTYMQFYSQKSIQLIEQNIIDHYSI